MRDFDLPVNQLSVQQQHAFANSTDWKNLILEMCVDLNQDEWSPHKHLVAELAF